jgi:hypothetical protein
MDMKIFEDNMIFYHLECFCNSPEHIVRFVNDPDDHTNAFYIEIQLNDRYTFLKKCWVALKYIFGYKSKFGHWDCVTVSHEECVNLKRFIEDISV